MNRRRTPALVALAALCGVVSTIAPARADHGSREVRKVYLDEIHPTTSGRAKPSHWDTGAALWANGSATGTTWLHTRAYRLTFRAGGWWCDGPPELEVRIDGELVGRQAIAGDGSYAIAGDWGRGDHHLSFRFVNDRLTDACDRNVWVKDIWFRGAHDETAEIPPSHRTTEVWTSTAFDDATVTPITAGRAGTLVQARKHANWNAELWGRGTLAFALPAQGAHLELEGGVDWCDGPPEVEVRVDGRVVRSGPMVGRSLSVPDVHQPGAPLLHHIEVELLNPHRGDGCQRRVWFHEARFWGSV